MQLGLCLFVGKGNAKVILDHELQHEYAETCKNPNNTNHGE